MAYLEAKRVRETFGLLARDQDVRVVGIEICETRVAELGARADIVECPPVASDQPSGHCNR